MANTKDGKFQKDDPQTKDAARKGGESSRSGSQDQQGSQGSKNGHGAQDQKGGHGRAGNPR